MKFATINGEKTLEEIMCVNLGRCNTELCTILLRCFIYLPELKSTILTFTVARVAEKSPAKPTRGFDFTASLITVARNEKRTIMNALMHNVEVTEFFDLKAHVRI